MEPKQWRPAPAPDTVWRVPAGLTRAQRSAEQDAAAGDQNDRLIRLPDGRTVTASIALRRSSRGRKVWAYLRYSIGGGMTAERYVGEAPAATRAENLAHAWQLARDKGLLGL